MAHEEINKVGGKGFEEFGLQKSGNKNWTWESILSKGCKLELPCHNGSKKDSENTSEMLTKISWKCILGPDSQPQKYSG